MSYTPGPWHALTRNRIRKKGHPTFDIMAGKGKPENWDMVADRVDGEDNARLIAIAPQMYELLRLIAEVVAAHCPHHPLAASQLTGGGQHPLEVIQDQTIGCVDSWVVGKIQDLFAIQGIENQQLVSADD